MKRIGEIITAAGILVLTASAVLAEDLVTPSKTYRNARVSRVDPDGIRIIHSAGVCEVQYADLPPEWQQRYGDDIARAAARLQAATAATNRGENAAAAAPGKLMVDLTILEVQDNGVIASGVYVTAEEAPREETADRTGFWKALQKEKIHKPLGMVFVVGPFPQEPEKGGSWMGWLYPAGISKDGRPVYALSEAKAAALAQRGSVPTAPPLHPLLTGLGDGLTWPLRCFGWQGLHFAPPEDREFRYWCGAFVGGCAYLFALLPLLRRKKEKRR